MSDLVPQRAHVANEVAASTATPTFVGPVVAAGTAQKRSRDCAKYIGRIGALAVALGVGAAVASSPGIAAAETGDSGKSATGSTSASSSPAGPKRNASSKGASNPRKRPTAHSVAGLPSKIAEATKSATTSRTPSNSSAPPSKLSTAKSISQATSEAEPDRSSTGEDAEAGTGDSLAAEADEKGQTAAALPLPDAGVSTEVPKQDATYTRPVATRTSRHAKADNDIADIFSVGAAGAAGAGEALSDSLRSFPRRAAATGETLSAIAESVAGYQTTDVITEAARSVPSHAEPVVTQAISAAKSVPQPATILAGLASGLLSLAGFNTHAANTPIAPADSPAPWALLGWIRRELTYTFFNKTPTLSYDASQTEQVGGAIFGALTGTDADNDKLTYTVTKAPSNGTVTVNPDGTFKYVPSAETVTTGGPDSFEVTVTDEDGNPFHLHGIASLWGGGSTATTVVTVGTVGQTSALVTPEQISVEQRAMAIANSPQMAIAKAALKTAWLATQQQAFADAGGIDAENMALLDDAVDEYAMYAAMAAVNISDSYAGKPSFSWIVTPPHTLDGQAVEGSRILSDNPDTLYRIAYVNPGASYVIHGKVNGEKPTDIVFTVQVGLNGQQGTVITGDDLVVNPDGTFTITADSDPTKIGQPNHLYLEPGTSAIFSRNTVTDWNTQQAMSLSIEQVDGPTTQLAPEAVLGIAQQVMHIGATSLAPAWFSLAAKTPVNELTAPANQGGPTLVTQMQSSGRFQLADDEAMVITVDPGSAKYFTIPVTNDWTVTPDYVNEPTSLNNDQAIANPDGTYTFVVSPTDPGVANWVSTGGLNQGTIYARFQGLDPASTDNPTLTTQVVKLDELDSVLPPTTVYVTPEERAQQIAERQSGYTLRTAPWVSTGDLTTDAVLM